MAKDKIKKQLEEGLKNAEQIVDVQIEGKPLPAPAVAETPAVVAPSAPTAGAQPPPPAPDVPGPSQVLNEVEAEITKVLNESRYFQRKYEELETMVKERKYPGAISSAVKALSMNISRSTQGQIPADQVESFLSNKILAKKAPTATLPGPELQVAPDGQTPLSVAPAAISEDILPGVATPEKTTTASTLDPSMLDRLRAADTAAAATRPGFDPDQREAAEFGMSESERTRRDNLANMDPEDKASLSQEADRIRQLDTKRNYEAGVKRDRENVPEFVKEKTAKGIRAKRQEVLDYSTLNPLDELYVLYTKYFGDGESSIRELLARDRSTDPENRRRGKLSMRQSMFHYALGYVDKSLQENPRLAKFRMEFDKIMVEAGVDQDLLNKVRAYTSAAQKKTGAGDYIGDVFQPFFGDAEPQNDAVVRDFIGEIETNLTELATSGSLRTPKNSSAITILMQAITEIDSDIINDSYLDFNPKKLEGERLQFHVERLKGLPKGLAERVMELTGVDLRTDIETDDGPARRSAQSPLTSNGVSFTGNNVVRYQTSSRRRYALDIAGVIDPRWQQVDAMGVGAPSFINPLHPVTDSTRAAIGFLVTTDGTADLHAAEGGKGKRDGRFESAIIREIKSALSGTSFVNTSENWDKSLSTDSDISVGEMVEYTTDDSLVQSEVDRRRSMLPVERFVIVKMNENDWTINSVLRVSENSGVLIGNDYGVLVLQEDSPFIDAAERNGGVVSEPFRIGDDIDLSGIVGKEYFAKLRVDIDPHVFPAVKHTLPLRDPMNRQSSVGLIPEVFVSDAPKPYRTTIHKSNGQPTEHSSSKIWDGANGDGDGGGTHPLISIRQIDSSGNDVSLWEGVMPIYISGTTDGRFPDMGKLVDPGLADEEEEGWGSRRRWAVGDVYNKTPRMDNREGRPDVGTVTEQEMRSGIAMAKEDELLTEQGVEKRDRPVRNRAEEDIIARTGERRGTSYEHSYIRPIPVQLDASPEESIRKTEALGIKSGQVYKRTGLQDETLAAVSDLMDHGAFSAMDIKTYRARLAMFFADLLVIMSDPSQGTGALGMLNMDPESNMRTMIDSGARKLKGEGGSPGKSEKPSAVESLGRTNQGLFRVGPSGESLVSGLANKTHLSRSPYTIELVESLPSLSPQLIAMFGSLTKTEQYQGYLDKLISSNDVEALTSLAENASSADVMSSWTRLALAKTILDMIPEDPSNYRISGESTDLKVIDDRIPIQSREPYDAGEIYSESESDYEIANRQSDLKRSYSEPNDRPDPVISQRIANAEGVTFDSVGPEEQALIKKIKGRLLFILAVRATKANFDARNNKTSSKARKEGVQSVRDTAPAIAALYDYASEVGITNAAIDTWLSQLPERMPAVSEKELGMLPDDGIFTDASKILVRTFERIIPTSTTPGLGMSRNTLQFPTAERLGVRTASNVDMTAYEIALKLSEQELIGRKSNSSSKSIEDMIRREEAALASESETGVGIDQAIEEMSPELREALELAREDSDLFSRVDVKDEFGKVIGDKAAPELVRLKKELSGAKDAKFRSLLIELMLNKGNITPVADSAYPDDFAKSMIQDDNQKEEGKREFKPRGNKDKITRGLGPDGSVDEYDAKMQRAWAQYVSENAENAGRKIAKVLGKVMTAPEGNYSTDETGSVIADVRVPILPSSSLSGMSEAQVRLVVTRAYLYYSMMNAFDQAGDGWVKFVNGILHADQIDQYITEKWHDTGGKMVQIQEDLFMNLSTRVIPQLTTEDMSDLGILSTKWKRIMAKSVYGKKLIDFAKANNLEFILVRTPRLDVGGQKIYADGKPLMDQVVYIAKATFDKKTKKFIEFDTLDDLSFAYGYQPLATETSYSETVDRINTMMRQHGAEGLFSVSPISDQSGRFSALINFNRLGELMPAMYPQTVIDQIEKKDMERYSDEDIRRVKVVLDSMVKYNFFRMFNKMATSAGLPEPYPDLTLDSIIKQNFELIKASEPGYGDNGLRASGDTTGPFGIRLAENLNNPHLPARGRVGREVMREEIPTRQNLDESGEAAIDQDIRTRLLSIAQEKTVADRVEEDPMLKASLEEGTMRGVGDKKYLTTSRIGAPEGSATREETDAMELLARRALSLQKMGKLNRVLNSGNSRIGAGVNRALGSRGAGFLAGAALIPFTTGRYGGLQMGTPTEEEAKISLAFEALGAVSPVVSSAAALGFTGMNRGDMLRTLVNIIGGFGGAAAGSVIGSALLPVGGTFAGGMAGSVAGSSLADNLYSNIAGNQPQAVPSNFGSVSTPQPAKEKDPFAAFKDIGG